jgi:cytochrome P450
MGFIAKHLAENPDDRRFLAANHSAIPMAIEEMIRRYASPSIARTVTRDTELGGVCLKKGDRIMLSTIAHGVDEKRWPDALKVKLDRRPIGHASFGKGVHACPGANLARTEIRIFIEEWLARIPDFSIEEGALLSYAPGQPSLLSLPLVW